MDSKQTPQQALPKIQQLLSEGKSCRLQVTGTSMVPFLRSEKDAVILSPLDRPARRGDILFYLRGEKRCLLHRVHKRLPDGNYLICGDNQTFPEIVAPEKVIGIAGAIERNGRHFSANNPLWRFLSLLWILLKPIRPALLAIIGWLWRVFKG